VTTTTPITETAKPAQPVERIETVGYLGTSAPPIEAPSWQRRIYIERAADLAALCRDLMQADVLALDAEFSQPRIRLPEEPSHRLALLQLAVDGNYRASYVVDTQRIGDLSPLQAPFADAHILKLFHGIGSDAKVLATRGLVARNTLDLEAVSRSLFGQRESGLQTMLLRACGVRLDKSYQRADWSRRPLTPGMLAYAAQDAEMTLVLYRWLEAHYAWAVALHHTPADEVPPAVAEWVLPYLEGSRPRHAALAVAEAGIATNITAQEQALRQALAAVHHPPQRARVMRLITDLELTRLAPDLRPYLTAPASEERQSAARAIGRLHDKSAIELIRPLLHDPVQDVRQAALLALEQLSGSRPPVSRLPYAHQPHPVHQPHTAGRVTSGAVSAVKWSSEPEDDAAPVTGGWQEALRARFGMAATAAPDDNTGKDDTSRE
jgi:ribonuclease D